MAKEMGFSARVIMVNPPPVEALKDRLKAAGKSDEAIERIVKTIEADTAGSAGQPSVDASVTNDELEASLKTLEDYIFGPGAGEAQVNGQAKPGDDDKAMADAPAESAS